MCAKRSLSLGRRATFRSARGRALSASALIVLGFWRSAWGDDALRQTIRVETVRIEVTWTRDEAELEAKRREYGTPRPPKGVIEQKLAAFSVLGKRNDELVCLIFSPKPPRFDDRINTSLGHELLHCLGFSHEGR